MARAGTVGVVSAKPKKPDARHAALAGAQKEKQANVASPEAGRLLSSIEEGPAAGGKHAALGRMQKAKQANVQANTSGTYVAGSTHTKQTAEGQGSYTARTAGKTRTSSVPQGGGAAGTATSSSTGPGGGGGGGGGGLQSNFVSGNVGSRNQMDHGDGSTWISSNDNTFEGGGAGGGGGTGNPLGAAMSALEGKDLKRGQTVEDFARGAKRTKKTGGKQTQ